jgi:hypothetical protein
VDLINLLIQEKQSRKFQKLDKKEEKINTVTINQTDGNRNNNQNINQNTNKRDKYNIYGCRHDGEYMVKKNIIPKDWQGSDEARKRFENKIDQYKKDKIKLDNSIINENKIRKNKSTLLVISVIFFDQY